MAKFDRIDGQFVAVHCTFHERKIFENAGWAYSRMLRRWVTEDLNKALLIHRYAVGAAKEHLDNVLMIRQETVAASWAEDTETEFPAPEGLSYMPFQKAGIEYALDGDRTLIADPPGLGKTIQAIGVHNVLACNKVLIVCPASLKVNWSREWRKWDVHGRSVGIAVSIPERYKVEEYDENTEEHVTVTKTRTRHDWPDTDVVIINYDMLFSFDDHVKATEWDLMICDEAHLLKTKTAVRTMCIFGGQKKAQKKDGKVVVKAKTLTKVKAKSHLFLTGTPILSKPAELWTLIRACDPKGLGKDWEYYAYRYCEGELGAFGLDSSGASNLDELGRILRERFMVRRDKEAVLKELPPKTREVIVLPQDKLERVIRKERSRVETAMDSFESMLGLESTAGEFRYLEAIDDLSERLSELLAEQESEEPNWNKAVRSLTPPEQLLFTELSEAREEVALGKVKLVVDHVKKLVECEEPVILFAHHKSVIDEIHKALTKAGIRVGLITGGVDPVKRQPVVDDFQDGHIDVILGNIFAMGVGLTMTRGRFVVFAELDWTPALIEQAEDRAWRHGQKNAVMVQYLIVDGSIEAQLAQTILAKMGVIFEALDAVSC